MTSYWDSWGSLTASVFSGDKRIPVSLFKEALEDLINGLHDYDHTHGGHVLDNWMEGSKRYSKIFDALRCAKRTHAGDPPDKLGHHFIKKKGKYECLYCKFSATKDFLVKIGWMTEDQQ